MISISLLTPTGREKQVAHDFLNWLHKQTSTRRRLALTYSTSPVQAGGGGAREEEREEEANTTTLFCEHFNVAFLKLKVFMNETPLLKTRPPPSQRLTT